MVALALIPPWQQPDEATHVARAELHRNRIALLDGSLDAAREGEILQSMARYEWWEHRSPGFETPVVIPKNFLSTDRRAAVPAAAVVTPLVYSLIAGRLLSWLPRQSVVEDLYFLRTMSAAFGMLTLWVTWLGARECLGARGGVTVAALFALHPQFAIVSTAATPDVIVNLLGAFIWWQTSLAVKRTHFLLPLISLWVAAIAAAAADRMGVPLLAVALVVLVAVLALRVPFRNRRALVTVPCAALLGLILFGTAMWALEAFGETYGWGRVFSGKLAPVPGAMTWSSFIRFTWFLHQSWWFSLGWRPYLPPFWWTTLAVMLTAVASFGIGRRLFRDKELDAETRTLVALGIVAIAVQAFAVYWTYFRLGNGAQGRYLFPFIVPSLVLLWSGVEAWVPRSRRAYAAGALVLLFALLDAVAWSWVAIPAYYASF